LNVFQSKNIPQNISQKNKENVVEEISLKKQDHLQSNGINPNKVQNGTNNIMRNLWQKLKSINIFAKNVAKNTKPQELQEQNIVQENVVCKTIKNQEECQNIGKIIDNEKKIDVYNISVKDCNEYFVNDILVHNCDSLVLACYPFLVDEDNFGSTVVEYDEVISNLNINPQNVRMDREWNEILLKNGIVTENKADEYGKCEMRGGRPDRKDVKDPYAERAT
jgi:hypothetical protein